MNTSEQLDTFMNHLDENRFYEAHEAIEVVWFKRRFEECNEVKLLKGFINASVSFELMKKGKILQSKKVWKNYLKYRQLLYKIDSPIINKYHQISRHIDELKLSFDII